ncbi:unnamed protein product, partial [Polarella glacialis]
VRVQRPLTVAYNGQGALTTLASPRLQHRHLGYYTPTAPPGLMPMPCQATQPSWAPPLPPGGQSPYVPAAHALSPATQPSWAPPLPPSRQSSYVPAAHALSPVQRYSPPAAAPRIQASPVYHFHHQLPQPPASPVHHFHQLTQPPAATSSRNAAQLTNPSRAAAQLTSQAAAQTSILSDDVVEFLSDLGFKHYFEAFRQSGFDEMDTIMEMSCNDMRGLGMLPGHVIKLELKLEQMGVPRQRRMQQSLPQTAPGRLPTAFALEDMRGFDALPSSGGYPDGLNRSGCMTSFSGSGQYRIACSERSWMAVQDVDSDSPRMLPVAAQYQQRRPPEASLRQRQYQQQEQQQQHHHPHQHRQRRQQQNYQQQPPQRPQQEQQQQQMSLEETTTTTTVATTVAATQLPPQPQIPVSRLCFL